jgi:hypothetical protein
MLNRRYTQALESIAKSQGRLAAADEKFHAAFLDWFFPDRKRQNAPNSPNAGTATTPPKQPLKR